MFAICSMPQSVSWFDVIRLKWPTCYVWAWTCPAVIASVVAITPNELQVQATRWLGQVSSNELIVRLMPPNSLKGKYAETTSFNGMFQWRLTAIKLLLLLFEGSIFSMGVNNTKTNLASALKELRQCGTSKKLVAHTMSVLSCLVCFVMERAHHWFIINSLAMGQTWSLWMSKPRIY